APYTFNGGGVGAPSLALSPTVYMGGSGATNTLFTIPSGNILGVNGGSYLDGNVTIPATNTSGAANTLTVGGKVGIGSSTLIGWPVMDVAAEVGSVPNSQAPQGSAGRFTIYSSPGYAQTSISTRENIIETVVYNGTQTTNPYTVDHSGNQSMNGSLTVGGPATFNGWPNTIASTGVTTPAAIYLNQNNTSKYYAGTVIQRQGIETWFAGVDNSTDNFHLNYNKTNQFLTVNTSGQVALGAGSSTIGTNALNVSGNTLLQSNLVKILGVGGNDLTWNTDPTQWATAQAPMVQIGGGGYYQNINNGTSGTWASHFL